MTLDEARAHIGAAVACRLFDDAQADYGVITSVNERFVFVCYGRDLHGKATSPEHLTLLGGA